MPAKSRSGSNKRQRTQQVKLSLLPSEQQALRILADGAGHRSVQSWIRATMAPYLARVTLADAPRADLANHRP